MTQLIERKQYMQTLRNLKEQNSYSYQKQTCYNDFLMQKNMHKLY